MAYQGKIRKRPAPDDSNQSADATLADVRFRALLSADDWTQLPAATRKRFSKRLAGGDTAVYAGEVVEVGFSRIGWWLAQIARLIGGPLPVSADTGVPSIVTVTEDAATGGQIWTRIYARRNGFPQVIHSSKRFAGPTGLEALTAILHGAPAWLDRPGTVVLRAPSGTYPCRPWHRGKL